jgi:hypothetical protein
MGLDGSLQAHSNLAPSTRRRKPKPTTQDSNLLMAYKEVVTLQQRVQKNIVAIQTKQKTLLSKRYIVCDGKQDSLPYRAGTAFFPCYRDAWEYAKSPLGESNLPLSAIKQGEQIR